MSKSLADLLGPIVASCALLLACDREKPVATADTPVAVADGTVSLNLNLGAIGVLARAAQMDPTRLILKFRSSQSEPRTDTIAVSGSRLVSKSFTLPSQQFWTLDVTGMDQRDSVLYSGSVAFGVIPNEVTAVRMNLSSRYSSLRIRFPIRDSLTRFVLFVDGNVWGDSAVARGVRVGEVLAMAHDYLVSSDTGTPHRISMRAYSSDALLYALDTSLVVRSGSAQGYAFTLNWLGPNVPPPGWSSLTVLLGSVGQVTLETSYADSATDFGIPWNPAIAYGQLIDDRDGKTYRTVKIGTQTWMAQNLNYRNTRGSSDTVGVCLIGNIDFCAKDTRFYHWSEVMAGSGSSSLAPSGVRGICPQSWHVPSDSEWRAMLDVVDSTHVDDATKLKSTTGWMWNGNGTDDYGFRALPYTRFIDQIGFYTDFWTATVGRPGGAWIMDFSFNPGYVFRFDYGSQEGLNSLRCVQD